MNINLNLLFEMILLLLAIIASNGIIYSLTYFNSNNTHSSENISVIRNNSDTDVLDLTLLIASNHLRITSSSSSDTNSSQTLSVSSSDISSSDTLEDEDLFDNEHFIDYENRNTILIDTQEQIAASSTGNSDIFDHATSLDSITILNSLELEQWRQLVHDLHDLPFNTPIGILQQIKFEELNILYRQDLIEFAITQSDLRHIIELIPAENLFRPDINHFILTIMSYFHQ